LEKGLLENRPPPLQPPTDFVSPLGFLALTAAFNQLRAQQKTPGVIFVSRDHYWSIRKFLTDQWRPETRAEWLKKGYMGTLWGVPVILHPEVRNDAAYVLASTDADQPLCYALLRQV
jgi:hypothetical protein